MKNEHFCFKVSGPVDLFNESVEPVHDKTNKITSSLSEDSDQSWYPPSLIRVFIVA